jgi:Cu(I)/Ag(I) efflux system periplasmic protein CusF
MPTTEPKGKIMKSITLPILVALAGTGTSLPAFTQTDHGAHGKAPASVSAVASPLSDGLVKKIDKANRKVTLSHGPLPNGMPAMTMVFGVKDAAWLDRMKVGQTIRFAAEEIKGAMVVVRFEPAQ